MPTTILDSSPTTTIDGETFTVEFVWPSPRHTTAHAYVQGAMTGDGSLCGVPLTPDHEQSMFANDPVCSRCIGQLTEGFVR